MRILSQNTQNIWQDGAYIGSQAPMVRVTVQKIHGKVQRYNRNEHYSMLRWGQYHAPKELPNVASMTWDRTVDTMVNECRVTFWNTSPLPIGNTPETAGDLDRRGYYTPDRGLGPQATRWGYNINEWRGLLKPDRVLRTYEGFGFDAAQPPELDPNVYLTGTWLITDVEFDNRGNIIVTCHDLSRELQDTIAFPPVVPFHRYPLHFERKITTTSTVPGNGAVTGTFWRPRYRSDSGIPYYGFNGSIHGHRPSQAFDGLNGTYWLSVGNSQPGADYAFEFIEGGTNGKTINCVRGKVWGGPYKVYCSIKTADGWQGRHVVPYNAGDPISAPNGANIPYVAHAAVDDEGTVEFFFKKAFTGVTSVRLTFTDLCNSGIGPYVYRAGVRELTVSGDAVKGADTVVTHTTGNYSDYCADTETEVLTKRGWLRYDEVQAGDHAFSINPTTGLSEWDLVTDVFRKHRQRDMVLMEGATHSSLTTPDHRWLSKDAASGKLRFRTTENLTTNDRLPFAAPRADAPLVPVHSDRFVELVAWWYTEGSRVSRASGEIGQSHRMNAAYEARIRTCLRELYGEPGERRRSARVHPDTVEKARKLCEAGVSNYRAGVLVGVSNKTIKNWKNRGWTTWALWNQPCAEARGMTLFQLAEPIVSDLDRVAPNKVPTMDFLAALTAEQLELFVSTSIDADGWRNRAGSEFFGQSDQARTSAFEAACALAGYGTSTSKADSTGHRATTVLKHQWFSPKGAARNPLGRFRITQVPYDGVIWCPTLAKNHTWLARRNGKVYFTGNTDIVKLFLSFGGFHWPRIPSLAHNWRSNGTYSTVPAPSNDPAIGHGRVWGDFMQAGVFGDTPLDVSIWDKKPLTDCIAYIRDILNFLFTIDYDGAVIWRSPNIWKIGNYVDAPTRGAPGYTSSVWALDERTILLDLTAKLSSSSMREKIFVANASGRYGAVRSGLFGTPNGTGPEPVNFRRVAGWTDVHFKDNKECTIMADLIALRQLMTYRTDRLTIVGYPGIQIDDQARIYERTSNEGWIHYISGIHASWEAKTRKYTYQLDTNWLGDTPYSNWAFDPKATDPDTQAYLRALGVI